jgi:hypothetical protein
MRQKLSLKFIQKSYWAIFCIILLSAALPAMSGCTTISGKQSGTEKTERRNKSGNELVGKWYKTQGGKFADYAGYAENLGNFESFEISEDGRVKSETLTAARNYDCIVEVSTKSEGTITRVSDSQLNIRLDAGTTRQTNSCSPEKNSADPTAATVTNYQWKLSEDEKGRAELCLIQPDGKTSCYRREE